MRSPGLTPCDLYALRREIADRLHAYLALSRRVTPCELTEVFKWLALMTDPPRMTEIYVQYHPRQWADVAEVIDLRDTLFTDDLQTLRSECARRARLDPEGWAYSIVTDFVLGDWEA